MAEDTVIVSIEDLTTLIEELRKYINESNAIIAKVIQEISSNSQEWNDDDFQKLLAGVSIFQKKIEYIEQKNNDIIRTAETKIEKINEIHARNI